MKIKSIEELKTILSHSDNVADELKNAPLEFINKIELKPSHTDNKKIYLTVIYLVGAALLLSILAVAILLITGEDEVNDFFVMIVSASIGALTGLLVPNPPDPA